MEQLIGALSMKRGADNWLPLAIASLALAAPEGAQARQASLHTAALDQADAHLKDARVMEALPFAIASVRAPGAVRGGDARGNDRLAQLGEARVVMDFGPQMSVLHLSGDGSTVVARTSGVQYWRYDGDDLKQLPFELDFLPNLADFRLSGDGKVLAFALTDSQGAVWRLEANGARREPPQPNFQTPLAISADGSVLASLGDWADSNVKLWRIGQDGMAPTLDDFGAAAPSTYSWALSADGRSLVARTEDGGAALWRFDQTGAVSARFDLGGVDEDEGLLISADGGVLVTRSAGLLNLWRGRGSSLQKDATPLGYLTDAALSADGAILVSGNPLEGVTIRRIGPDGVREDAKKIDGFLSFALAANGRVLVTSDADQVGRVWRIGPEGAAKEKLAVAYAGSELNRAVSDDGQRIATVGVDQTGVLQDIGVRAWTGDAPRGASLSKAVCSLSGDFVRPLRVGPDETAPIAAMLRGRLANPCDWRGLLAVFPNQARGDGWFEGVRQWSRLMGVRHFGADAAPCDATTFGASAATKAARKRMCDLYVRPGAPTQQP